MITDQDFYDCQMANFGMKWRGCEYFDEGCAGFHGHYLIASIVCPAGIGADDARCMMQQLVADYLGLGAP